MSLAESAIFLGFHTIRMSLLILCCIVVTILAFCASKCNSCTHNFTSVMRVVQIRARRYLTAFIGVCPTDWEWVFPISGVGFALFFRNKKIRPFPVSLDHYITPKGPRQLNFQGKMRISDAKYSVVAFFEYFDGMEGVLAIWYINTDLGCHLHHLSREHIYFSMTPGIKILKR